MKTIWKYPLEVTDRQKIRVPEGGKILSLQVQKDVPCLWIEVDTMEDTRDRIFVIFGTGHQIEADRILVFVGTFQTMNGSLVFHVYEEE